MLDPPTRPWAWKSSLSAAPVCVAIGGLSRAHHGVVFSEILATSAAALGIAFTAWSIWRERKYKVIEQQLEEAQSTFVAAAEASLDAFSLLDAVRNPAGEIVDFRIRYLNKNAEALLGRPRLELVGKNLCSTVSSVKSSGRFDRYRNVIETGIPMSEEYPTAEDSFSHATWIRYQAVKLGDSLAVTASDISAIKAAQARYEHLVEFNDSVFQNAPFSIVATDVQGTIKAINVAAEKLTGYSREELVDKAPLTTLHDERELAAAARDAVATDDSIESAGFEVLSAGAREGEMEEKEWTLVKRDGSRTPVKSCNARCNL